MIDFEFARIYLPSSRLNSSDPNVYRHLINHEVGHTLGLDDGGPRSRPATTCTDSIMHSVAYGCSVSRPWPSDPDRLSVQGQAYDIGTPVDGVQVLPYGPPQSQFSPPDDGSSPDPDLRVVGQTASPTGSVLGGTAVRITITVKNEGPSGANNVVLRDRIPDGTVLRGAASSQGYCIQSRPVECRLGSMSSGSQATVTTDVEVDATYTGSTANEVQVKGDSPDPRKANNEDDRDLNVFSPPDLSVQVTGSASSLTVGQDVVYTLTAANQGSTAAASNVRVTTALPVELEYRSYSNAGGWPATCTHEPVARQVLCEFGSLPAGQTSASVSFVARALQPGVVSNSATIRGGQADPNSGTTCRR